MPGKRLPLTNMILAALSGNDYKRLLPDLELISHMPGVRRASVNNAGTASAWINQLFTRPHQYPEKSWKNLPANAIEQSPMKRHAVRLESEPIITMRGTAHSAILLPNNLPLASGLSAPLPPCAICYLVRQRTSRG